MTNVAKTNLRRLLEVQEISKTNKQKERRMATIVKERLIPSHSIPIHSMILYSIPEHKYKTLCMTKP